MAKAATASRVRSTKNRGSGVPRVVRVDSKSIQARQALSIKLGDALLEALGGMGTDKDKLASATYSFTYFDPAQATMAYRSDWIARKIVDIPAWDSTREWRNWQADDDDITALEDAEEQFSVQQKVMQAQIKARLYGGSALILGVDQGKNEDELVYEQIKKDALKFIHVVSRHEIAEQEIEQDIASPWYGEPKFYGRNSGTDAGVRFHPSRVIPFVGAPLQEPNAPTTVWGDSILQIVMEAVKACGLVTNSAAQLVAEAKIDIIKIPGLSENISTKKYEDNLKTRFGVANLIKSVYSMLLIDKEEEWERQNAQFAGLADMLNMYMLMACGAADIPATRFLGQSPAGLSATGESDIRNYYDAQASKQKLELGPRMSRLDAVLIPSTFGTTPEEIFYLWNPLWQMSDAEKSKIATEKATVMKADVDAALIEPMVLKQARQNQLIEDGTYPGLELILAEFDADNVDPGENQGPVVDPITGETKDPITGEVIPPAANENDPDAPVPGEEDEDEEAVPPKRKRPAADAAWSPGKKRKRGHKAGSYASMRQRVQDATPRPLYVKRKVLNAADIQAWAKAQGFTSMLEPEDLHVTIAFSRTAIDWTKLGEAWGQNEDGSIRVKPGGPRLMEQFNSAQVLVFACNDLQWRHQDVLRAGGSWDFEDYNPHITITYKGVPADLRAMEPYQGEIVLGPEEFKEITPSMGEDIPEVDL